MPLKQQNLPKNRFSLNQPPVIKNTTPPPSGITVEVNISNGGVFQLHGSDSLEDDCAQLGFECWSCLADLTLSLSLTLSGSDGWEELRQGWGLPTTVPSYHEAATLLRVESACSRRTFQTHPEVGHSRGGRKGRTMVAFLAGSGVRKCSIVPFLA